MKLSIPIPSGVLIFALKLLPIPGWLKGILIAATVVMDRLPGPEKAKAKDEIKAAAQTKDADEVARVARRVCEGVGCASDTKGL